jgi:hypothetical protein
MSTTFFFGLLGLYLIYGIITSRNNSATPVIERRDIRHVTYNPGIPGLTRARFEVTFNNSNGQIKKRLIMLPGTLAGSRNERDSALQIMREEKLVTA